MAGIEDWGHGGGLVSGNGSHFIEVTGEVLEANLRERQFQLWTDESNHVLVILAKPDESAVITALKEHALVRLRVRGWGEIGPNGKLLRITQVQELTIQPTSEIPRGATARPVEDIIRELGQQVPQSEWDRLPLDLTDNLDHYLYGTPKR